MTTARAKRALERQLAYQEKKAREVPEDTRPLELELLEYARWVRARIEKHHPIEPGARVLEVGSGAHGLSFSSASTVPSASTRWRTDTTPVPPMAIPRQDDCSLRRIAALRGWVVRRRDLRQRHRPRGVSPTNCPRARARARPGRHSVLHGARAPPDYGVASRLHGLWRALRVPLEIGPFADHTVHLTVAEGRRLFDGLGLRTVHEETGVEDARAEARQVKPRHAGDRPSASSSRTRDSSCSPCATYLSTALQRVLIRNENEHGEKERRRFESLGAEGNPLANPMGGLRVVDAARARSRAAIAVVHACVARRMTVVTGEPSQPPSADGEQYPLGPQSASTRQLLGRHWLPPEARGVS